MSHDLALHHVHSYVNDAVNFLLSKITRESSGPTPIAGWHNFFRPGRIGTTGSAVPLLFLHQLNVEYQYRQEVINKLLTSQFDEGCWAILSLGDIPTVEGTVWPMRALAKLGDLQARQAVSRAENWLLSQQSGQGAWGSTAENSPRTLLTAISLGSLAVMAPPSATPIRRAIEWFSQHQRSNGAWGEEPGRDGTVFHTATVSLQLLELGIPGSDPRISKALSYLRDFWRPDKHNILQEIYDVHFDDTYSRVIVEHDVDAAVIRLLLRIRPPWGMEMVVAAASDMITSYLSTNKLSPAATPSIWNIIPRATAFHELLQHFPVSEEGAVLSFKEAIVYAPSKQSGSKFNIAKFLLARIIIPQFRLTSLFLLCFLIITSIMVYLYYNGTVQLKDVFLSLGVELAGLSLGIYYDRRSRKR